MTSNRNESRATVQSSASIGGSGLWWNLVTVSAISLLLTLGGYSFRWWPFSSDPQLDGTPAELVMKDGDPYIRALMRTISASEANSSRPYSLLYGGEHIPDLSHHPDRCITILTGPNVGDCSTAAGRYQMITTTWQSESAKYHPQRHLSFWKGYDFSPENQDLVVYRWLNDPSAWGADLSQLLQDGHLNEVLRILSPTWTSLGYGIETNDMTGLLPQIYEEALQEELAKAKDVASTP